MTNIKYVKNILANCDGNLCLPILHLQRVELHCKLQEKLHRVTGPLQAPAHFKQLAVLLANHMPLVLVINSTAQFPTSERVRERLWEPASRLTCEKGAGHTIQVTGHHL